MQKAAMNEVEKETRKFVKMVRIVRDIQEDQQTLYTPLAQKQGSQPYFLDQDPEEPENIPQG
jgi:hypothetical protein